MKKKTQYLCFEFTPIVGMDIYGRRVALVNEQNGPDCVRLRPGPWPIWPFVTERTHRRLVSPAC